MKNIPQNYKQTELGILPNDWQVVRLGDIFEFLNGYGLSKKDININGKFKPHVKPAFCS